MKFARVVTIALFFSLFFRLFVLQIKNGSSYFQVASQNFFRKKIVVAERGLIKDRQGVVLASSQPSYRLVGTNYPDIDKASFLPELRHLSELLAVDLASLRQSFAEASANGVGDFVLLADIPREQALTIESVFANSPFFRVETTPRRFYPQGEAFSHLLGFVGQVSSDEFERSEFSDYLLGEVTGKEGLEKQYENLLRGKRGAEIVQIDARGAPLKTISRRDAVTGQTLTLTIDSELQKYLYQLLKKDNRVGSIIVSDLATGGILSAVNYPSFDNNAFAKADSAVLSVLFSRADKPLFNRFLAGQYPPGSTFKLVMAVSALAEGVIAKDTLLEAPGAISYGAFSFHDWRPEGHGVVNVVDALAKSADTFFYKIGGGYEDFKGLGVTRIYQWARKFGLGKPTGIDLPGESFGLTPNPSWKKETVGESWYLGNTYHLSIGQGDLLTTPLQVNYFTNIVANKGALVTPHLLAGDRRLAGQLAVSPEIFVTVTQGMIKACSPGGTAYPLFEYAGKIACKTGTSETGVKDKTHAWLTMFFPVDKPAYSVTVFLENGGGGAQDASPIAKKVYQFMLENIVGQE